VKKKYRQHYKGNEPCAIIHQLKGGPVQRYGDASEEDGLGKPPTISPSGVAILQQELTYFLLDSSVDTNVQDLGEVGR